ncbi:hypothetical protein DFP72DRAFT_916524 [Ephemerocybe angulata]|uniref:Uncharacterized protein n=1 Tax=Ephemerocybe angulata TaxID=980116 RepID=A0A8H6HJU7_9AGAR|nr:hypothetical protein DFP72DRAFT_916524 [Tulosesus angulatus]
MDSHPNLTSISFPFRSWPSIRKWTFLDRSQPFALASDIPRGAFPNLEDVHFSECTNNFYDGGTGNWNEPEKFLAAHGKSLELVHISARLWVVDQHCPRIKEIGISFNKHHGAITVNATMLRRIRETTDAIRMQQFLSLGLRMCHLTYDDGRVEALCSIASLQWTDIFPRLQRIRVLEELDVESSRVHDATSRKSSLEASGTDSSGIITSEDIEGRLLGQLSMGGS